MSKKIKNTNYWSGEDIQVSSSLKQGLADTVNEYIGYWINNSFTDNWRQFVKIDGIWYAEFHLPYNEAEDEGKVINVRLIDLVDRTIHTTDNKEFLSDLSKEFRRFADIIDGDFH